MSSITARPLVNYVSRAAIAIVLLLLPSYAIAEKVVKWKILSPLQDSVTTNQNLFVSLQLPEGYNFANTTSIQVYMDNVLLAGNVKVNANKLGLFYPCYLKDGRHELKVEARIAKVKHKQAVTWAFYVNRKDNTAGTVAAGNTQWETIKLGGIVSADNRNEFLTGSGANLRQEPDYTRTLNADVTAKYKDASMILRTFITSNNNLGTQSMNYYMLGFKNRWIEVEAGDINPMTDRLILTGVRMRGGKLKFRYKSTSIQFFYGTLNQAVEGGLQTYIPGSGVLPSNLVNDSQYIVPGTYRRTMMATRFETGNRKDIFKFGLTGFRGKDDITSIKYGVAPKENIAGGADLALRLFRKTVTIQSGIAASVFSNDISTGPIDKHLLDSIYHIKLDFEPSTYRDLIILNSSTVPTRLKGTDFMAYYSQLNYTNKYQSFFFEYKRNGPLYNSMGNPFIENNYDGYTAGDRFSLFKRILSVDLRYQNYSNDLNQSLPSKINTVIYSGNLFVNPGKNWPAFMFNYMDQLRNGNSISELIPPVNESIDNYMLNISLSRKFWNINHSFRIMFNVNDRNDKINPSSGYTLYNGMFGINEGISPKLNINADIGKAITRGDSSREISNNNTYNLSIDWKIKPGKYYTSLAFSNNTALATILSNASYRLSLIARFGYKFYKGMGIDLEGGYQPYRDQSNSLNNYNDAYIYIRYSCDLSMLKF